MGYKLDITNIVRDHVKTLVNDSTGKPDGRDWFFFVLMPVGIASILVYKSIFLNDNYINAVISGLSIYVGLSLNLIVLLFEIVQKERTTPFEKGFAKDLIANISFSIVLSIFTILFSIITQFDFPKKPPYSLYTKVTNWIAYFLLVQMLVSILLLVRNMYFQMLKQIK